MILACRPHVATITVRMRPMFRTAVFVVAALAILSSSIRTDAASGQPPNILFIIADDQSYETVGALGHQAIETPSLDRLVKEGITFTHAYNQGSWTGAVCVASRTMLNTGRFLWQAHRLHRGKDQDRFAGLLWSDLLRSAGYTTYMTGKWHIEARAEKAFDHVANVRGGMPDQTNVGYHRPVDGQGEPWKPWDTSLGGYWKGGRHWSEIVADDATSFLKIAEKADEPFFMYVAFNAPHDPRQSPKEYVQKYPRSEIAVPANFLPRYPFHDKIGCGPTLRDESLAPFPRTEHAVRVHRQEYFAIISHMDTQIGRILDALQESGKADHTYVFFTADHGLAVGHHGLLGKQNLYDHSVRVPFLVTGPGVTKGKKVRTPIYMQDVMPTTLELGGLEVPDDVQFRSVLPMIRGKTDRSHYEAIYGAYLDLQRSVCWGDYKLIRYPKIEKTRLYNLKDDPEEMNDLADRPESEPIIDQLLEELATLQKETDDPLSPIVAATVD